MNDARLPEEVRTLVRNHIASMVHLEALLMLSAAPGESLSAEAVAGRISAGADATAKALADLHAASLLAAEESGGATAYRFAPGDGSLRHGAEMLARMYQRFPVQMIRAVYEGAIVDRNRPEGRPAG